MKNKCFVCIKKYFANQNNGSRGISKTLFCDQTDFHDTVYQRSNDTSVYRQQQLEFESVKNYLPYNFMQQK